VNSRNFFAELKRRLQSCDQLSGERASFRSGEIHVFDSSGNVERVIPFDDTNRKRDFTECR